MVLDSEQQRQDLLAMIGTVTLAGGTVEVLRKGIEEVDALKKAVTDATISSIETGCCQKGSAEQILPLLPRKGH